MVQCEPENSGIERQLLDSSNDFKYSNEHETQQLCSVNRVILCKKWFNKLPAVQIFAL